MSLLLTLISSLNIGRGSEVVWYTSEAPIKPSVNEHCTMRNLI